MCVRGLVSSVVVGEVCSRVCFGGGSVLWIGGGGSVIS